ncbi:PASTA domain-containing protein [Gallalistipes aquisgranensis]|uniref:PASTA domain-containing protein n=1 Tax=Gallalistipes aquisgranensis TaxID=2779358 RepID=UPI001CF84B70|nr:PASTA domain-containing protein [Gallalistipes aquisgranensis]MBE5033981.1 PASTA domain-containing protein [Gallalistipes aquisgranensis]
MNPLRKLIERINGNVIARNVVLAVCAVVIFLFLVSVLLNLFTRHNKYKQVPDFSGMNIEEARQAGRKASLRIEINDSLYVPMYEGGVILDQNPAPGAEVKSGRRIFVTVNSFRQKMVRIPYVTDFSLRQAKNNLEVAGLEIDRLIYREDIATNYVLEEHYRGELITSGSDVRAEVGTGVTLVVGMSPEDSTTVIPKVVGFPLKEAKSRLWEVGLNVGRITAEEGINALNENEARVYMQEPEQSHLVTLGTPVALKLTLDTKKVEQGSAASDRAAEAIVEARKEQEEAEKEKDKP